MKLTGQVRLGDGVQSLAQVGRLYDLLSGALRELCGFDGGPNEDGIALMKRYADEIYLGLTGQRVVATRPASGKVVMTGPPAGEDDATAQGVAANDPDLDLDAPELTQAEPGVTYACVLDGDEGYRRYAGPFSTLAEAMRCPPPSPDTKAVIIRDDNKSEAWAVVLFRWGRKKRKWKAVK